MAGYPLLLIRADADIQMGTGHVMRCLALGQAWQERGGRASFAMSTSLPALEARLASEGIGIVHLNAAPGSRADAEETACLARDADVTWVVVDGYQFDANYQRLVKETGLRLLFIDDYGHASHYYADLVLNQNIYAREALYSSRELYTRLLLGTRYALLRREFWPWQGWRREIAPIARKVLVTLGGSDPDNVTLVVLRAIQHTDLNGIEVIAVLGGGNPHIDLLLSAAQDSRFPVHVQRNAANMPELMAWADVAISSAGSTSYELAFMGLPSIVLVLADNQRPIARALDASGAAVNLVYVSSATGLELAETLEELAVSASWRSRMSSRGSILVDGWGSPRTAESLR